MKTRDDVRSPANSEFHCNNEILGEVISVGGKQAAVVDHMIDALCDKFKDHPEILGNLFSVKPVSNRRHRSTIVCNLGAWATVTAGKIPQRSSRILKFSGFPGEPFEYVVRFVGEPITFYRYTINGRSAICGDHATCPMRVRLMQSYGMHASGLRKSYSNILAKVPRPTCRRRCRREARVLKLFRRPVDGGI